MTWKWSRNLKAAGNFTRWHLQMAVRGSCLKTLKNYVKGPYWTSILMLKKLVVLFCFMVKGKNKAAFLILEVAECSLTAVEEKVWISLLSLICNFLLAEKCPSPDFSWRAVEIHSLGYRAYDTLLCSCHFSWCIRWLDKAGLNNKIYNKRTMTSCYCL